MVGASTLRVGGETPLRGKRALVTGAASGIGKAVAQHLSGLGARVTFSDLDPARLAVVTDGMAGAGAIAAALSDRVQVERLARDVGPVDILVNNAGLQQVNAVESFEV